MSEPCQGFLTELVLRCGRKDELAMAELFDLTFFLVAGTVNGGGPTPAVTDDGIVGAFWRIWHQAPTYQPHRQEALAWVLDQALEAALEAAQAA